MNKYIKIDQNISRIKPSVWTNISKYIRNFRTGNKTHCKNKYIQIYPEIKLSVRTNISRNKIQCMNKYVHFRFHSLSFSSFSSPLFGNKIQEIQKLGNMVTAKVESQHNSSKMCIYCTQCLFSSVDSGTFWCLFGLVQKLLRLFHIWPKTSCC